MTVPSSRGRDRGPQSVVGSHGASPSERANSLSPARNVKRRVQSGHDGVPRDPQAPASIPPPVSSDVVAPAAPKPPASDSQAMRVLRAVFGVVMVVGIGSGVVWGARRYVHTSPRFGVSEIITSGGKRRSPDDIASIAGIAKGENVFAIDLGKARARLAADPWIDSAELTRQLPGTISIRVTEREAAGVVATVGDAGTYLVTRDGAIIKRIEAGDPLDFHVVTGIALKTLVDDREGATRTIRQALDLAYDYDRSPLAQRSPVQEVHVEPRGDLMLVVGKHGVVLRMGAGPYRRKLEQAARIAGELDRRGAKPSAIMLDDEARPDRVVVRMR